MLKKLGAIDRPAAWFIAALALEVAIFYLHVQIRVAPNYPQVYDQLTYINATHDIVRDFHARGLAALAQPFLSPAPTGITYPIQGAAAVLAFGASRAALLTVNLAYFLALQIAVFLTMRRSRDEAAAAWLSIALLIGCDGVFRRAGGIADYRIDFAAMCLFGIWICLLVKADQFASRKFSILAGLAAAWLILMRFITAAYIGPIMAALLCWLIVRRRSAENWRRRIANYFLSGAIITVVIVPTLVAALGPINNYYVAGHIEGAEPAIRAAEVGIFDLTGHLLYYPRALLSYQIGSVSNFLIVIVLTAIALVFVRRSKDQPSFSFEIFLGTIATILPTVILTLDVSKSPVVIGIAMVPFILLVMFCWRSFVLPIHPRRALRFAVLFYMIVGFSAFVAHAASPSSELSQADLAEVKRLNLAIANAGGGAPHIAFDRLTDYLNPSTVQFYFRESNQLSFHGEPQFTGTLGGIFALNPEDVMRAVESSNVVVLSDQQLKRSHSPFDQSILESWPMMDGYAKKNMQLLTTGKIDDITYRIFVRPT
jgi:hypothetical protein